MYTNGTLRILIILCYNQYCKYKTLYLQKDRISQSVHPLK